MKKLIAVLLTAVMLFSVVVMMNVSAEETAYNVPIALAQFGHPQNYLGADPIETAPVADGAIGEDEYTIVNEIAVGDQTSGTDAGAIDFNEYIAVDNEYIYYALEGNFSKDTYLDLRITPTKEELTQTEMTEVFNDTKESWYQVKITDSDSDGNYEIAPWRTTTPSLNVFSTFEASQSEVVGTVSETGLVIVEWKISRTYLDSEHGMENVTAYRYYLKINSNAAAYGTPLDMPLKVALGNPPITNLPKFILLSELGELPETSATEPPQQITGDIRDIIMDAGYGLEVNYIASNPPMIDGFQDPGEWNNQIPFYSGTDGKWNAGINGAIGAAQSFAYAVEQDEEYIYICVLFQNGNGADRGMIFTLNAINRELNTPIDLQAVKGKGGRLHFGPIVGLAKNFASMSYIGFDGEPKDSSNGEYFEAAVGVSDDGTTSVNEFKIKKQLILDEVNAAYGLEMETLEYFDIALHMDNYYTHNWGMVGATPEALGLDPLADGMTLDDGTPIDVFGMPVFLTVDPEAEDPTASRTTAAPITTPAPTTADPSNGTTAAPTTAAPTTAKPADATTAAPAEKKGCGGSISLAAIAIVPVLACGVAFTKKKKED